MSEWYKSKLWGYVVSIYAGVLIIQGGWSFFNVLSYSSIAVNVAVFILYLFSTFPVMVISMVSIQYIYENNLSDSENSGEENQVQEAEMVLVRKEKYQPYTVRFRGVLER